MILRITDLHTTPFKIFLFIITTNPFQQGLARKDFNQVSLHYTVTYVQIYFQPVKVVCDKS
jgi:hypothetical protein